MSEDRHDKLEGQIGDLIDTLAARVSEGQKGAVNDYEALVRCFVALRASRREDVRTKILAADFVAKISDPAMRERLRELFGVETKQIGGGE